MPDPKRLCNAFIAAPPQHPAFKRAIDLIRTNVRHCFYTTTDLGVTGPKLWHTAAHPHSPKVLGKLESCPEFEGCSKIKNLLTNKIPTHVQDFAAMGYTPKKKYTVLWARGRIYPQKMCKLTAFADMFWL